MKQNMDILYTNALARNYGRHSRPFVTIECYRLLLRSSRTSLSDENAYTNVNICVGLLKSKDGSNQSMKWIRLT